MTVGRRSIVLVGGSIAAVTAAETLREQGFEGELTILSEELHAPYSRVPLSKGVLAGRDPIDSVTLPALGEGIVVRTGARAVALLTDRRRVLLADGEEVPYDGLVIATGGRARRIGRPDQTGEMVLRTKDDAERLAVALVGARDVVVVGGGVLGMEIASTCRALGLDVTVIDREPPLQRLLGPWLAELLVTAAASRGIRFVVETNGVRLIGLDHIEGVKYGDRRLYADVVISACGDQPNTGWLDSCGLAPRGLLLVDDTGRVAFDIVAAGDVAAHRGPDNQIRRDPFWTNAVQQGQAAAKALLHADDGAAARPDQYFWTEHPDVTVKISGHLPVDGPPEVMDGSIAAGSGLFRWHTPKHGSTAVAVNHRMSVVALKRLGSRADLRGPHGHGDAASGLTSGGPHGQRQAVRPRP